MTRTQSVFLALGLSTLVGCGEDDVRQCNALYCPSGATFELRLDTDIDSLRASTIEVCRDGLCFSRSLNALPAAVEVENSDPRKVYVKTVEGDAGGVALRVEYTDRAELFKNGDEYEITIRNAAGEAIVNVQRTVQYRESEPNGKGCGICRQVTVDADAIPDAG